MEGQRYLYLTFSATPLKIGSMIRRITNNPYNHVSASFERDPEFFYSFARYHINAPFAGGFIIESRERFLLNDNKGAKIKIYAFPLSDRLYRRLKGRVDEFKTHRDKYIYNTFSALLLPFGRTVRIQGTYTCAEFAADLLITAEYLPRSYLCKPITLPLLEAGFERYRIYEGEMPFPDGYAAAYRDGYFRSRNPFSVCCVTFRHFYKLISRLF